jgi:sortase A
MEPSPGARHIPATLVIPSIGVQALIEQVGLDQNDNMAIPRKPMEVGWYSPGPAPGEAGDAVIDGHLDWYGMPRAVFYNLDKLKPGDEIDVVAQDGARLRFAVHGLATYPYTAHPAGLFDTTGRPQLSLVTCSGAWDAGKSTYNQRLVVDSTLQGTGTGGWGAADRA